MHGGRGNSAPKSKLGKENSAAANLKTGRYTKAAKFERSKNSARLSQLEDAMQLLKMTSNTKRIRGRKSALYLPITNLEGLRTMMLDDLIHPVSPTTKG